MALMTGDEKHDPAATSTLDVLWVLYDRVLNVSPATVEHPDRDRLYLSKGHGPMAYYAVLAAKGFIPPDWLPDWVTFDSPLGFHPDRNLVPGVEISSGSLGHGFPLAVGTAVALRAQRSSARIIVLVGDAELDEGSNDEAIAFAAATGLSNLTVVVIDNRSASYPAPQGLSSRFAVAGWRTVDVDGHDREALTAAFSTTTTADLTEPGARPLVVVAHVEGRNS